MNYNFDSERPIYLQIIDFLKNQIINGTLKSGDKIPSVRELALTFKVNPNTIVKALYFLETEKLIYTDRTNGKFVTSDKELIKQHKESYIKQKINNFLNDVALLGYTKEDVVKLLKEVEK